MGAYHGAEACELVGLYLLHLLVEAGYFPKALVGLYRDDGLATHARMPGRELEKTKQKLLKRDILYLFLAIFSI